MQNENKAEQVRIENWNQVRDELMNALRHLYYIGAPEVQNFEFYIHDLYESMHNALQVAKAVQGL